MIVGRTPPVNKNLNIWKRALPAPTDQFWWSTLKLRIKIRPTSPLRPKNSNPQNVTLFHNGISLELFGPLEFPRELQLDHSKLSPLERRTKTLTWWNIIACARNGSLSVGDCIFGLLNFTDKSPLWNKKLEKYRIFETLGHFLLKGPITIVRYQVKRPIFL